MARRLSFALVGLLGASPVFAQPETAPAGAALSFEDAVGAAERAAESMDVARAEVERAQSTVTSARSLYFPQINGTAAYQRTLASEFDDIMFGPPDPSAPDVDLPFGQPNNWRLGLNVTQPLFDGFKTRANVRAARAGVRASELGVKTTRAQVVLQAGQAYLDAVLAQRQVEIAEVTLQQAEQTFNETKLGFQNGATPEFDLVRAEVARDNQRTLLVQFQVQRDVTLVALRRLIGQPPGTPLSLTTKLDSDDVEAVVGVARTAAGVQPTATRVAIAQAKEGVAARQAGVDAAKADRFPTISAGTDFGLVNYENQPFNNEWRTNWTLGVTLSLPIFDGFRRRAAIATQGADLSAARAQLAQAGEVSQVETEQALANVKASTTQLETSMRTVKQAQRAYEIAKLRFEQGASTHLELVDTRVQLEQALLNQAKSARDLRVARLRQELLPALPLGAAAGF